MSNHQEVIDLAKGITNNEHLYSVQPFIKITGDTTLGLFLERIVYWSDRSANKELRQLRVFYKSAEEWEDELGLSYAQVTRARKSLEVMGFIQAKKHKVNGAPTFHYYANMEAIKLAVATYYQNQTCNYSNLENLEIQETSISENSEMELEESAISIEIQETSISSYNSSNSTDNSSLVTSPNGEEGDKSPSPTEKIQEQKSVEPEPEKPPPKIEYTPFQREFLSRFNAKRFKNPTQLNTVAGLTEQFGETELEALVEWAANKGMGLGQAIPAIKSALTNPKRQKNGTNQNGPKRTQQPNQTKSNADQPAIDADTLRRFARKPT